MNTILYTFLLSCSVFLVGCCRPKQVGHLAPEKESPRQIPEVASQKKETSKQISEAIAIEKEPLPMIQIQNLSFEDKILTLDFKVLNPLKDDIWICYDASVSGKQKVQSDATRIDAETVWIKHRRNRERFPGFVNPYSVAKYIRLQPGESFSGRIVQDLPIKDYVREWRESRKEHKEITLHRAIFEVGYFGTKWNKFLDSQYEEIKKKPIKPKPKIDGPYFYIPLSPLITEEPLFGQLREVMYLQENDPFRKNEESAKVFMTDVAIPCSVVVDDK